MAESYTRIPPGPKAAYGLELVARFLSHTDRAGSCWLWTRHRMKNGYAQTYFGGRKRLVHRVSYELFVGPPLDLMVLHRCDVRHCVNPEHLFLGTAADNTHDMIAKGRHSHGDDHWARSRRDEFLSRVIAQHQYARGSAHHNAKLTEDKVREIRGLFDAGLTDKEIAPIYGVCSLTIRYIRIGKWWRHVA